MSGEELSTLLKCLDYGLLTLTPATCSRVMRRPDATAAQTVLVEFSSLNIAKPMHMGHFRATVVGNFVKNINLAAGNRVIAVNYLGDWGTQFGMLSLGYEQFGNSQMLDQEPLKHLHSVYVQACQVFGASEGGKREASALATSFEKEDNQELRNLWTTFRSASLVELKCLYSRMNVHFDRYEYESQYVKEALQVVNQLISRRIAKMETDGSVTGPSYETGKRVTLLKSDGGTLYLARDLAAAVSRCKNLEFDRMHYVVEDGQREHFLNLQHLLTRLGYSWAKPRSSPWPLHVRFARVSGASSRLGDGVFLSDVLDAARLEAFQRMQHSPNTRTFLHTAGEDHPMLTSTRQLEEAGSGVRQVADQMGVTWLVAEMLKKPRLNPVNMRITLQKEKASSSFVHHHHPPKGDTHSHIDQRDLTGLGLQYCHARLCSLEEKALAAGLIKMITSLDVDSEALLHSFSEIPSNRTTKQVEEELLAHLAMLPETLTHAYVKYEANGIFRYCNRLTALVNRAWCFLPVLGATSKEVALSRLAIFRMSRNSLATCLSIMGVKPLSKI